MKAEYNIGFPGYKSYKVSKEKTRELTRILVDYADSNSPCIKISFDEREEFDHAVSIVFTFTGMFGDISLNIDSAELCIYLSRCILRVSRALFTDKLITCHGDLDH